jgi:predicted ATPase/DNA-binding SARP family transcriptional activator
MDAAVEVLLLGPIEARRGGEPVALAGSKLQALVALLALSAPHSVSDDRLIDELWGDAALANPANALQAQVSQLRRVLGRDAVTRQPSGYALAIDPGAVDATALERLVRQGGNAAAEGNHRQAAAEYQRAVALLRGVPLTELLDYRFARDAALRLEDLMTTAHEGFIDAELALGRHNDVVARLTELIGAYPLRERLHAQLITALYRSGRQSDALRAFQNVRTILADEMGLDPGPELRALERAVLAHDPALAAPVPLTSTFQTWVLPVPLTSFVGRAAELGALDTAMETARLVTLVGPGGVGKSRVVLEMASQISSTRETWFVELAPVTDPVAVPETIASVLGAHEQAPTESSSRAPEVRVVERIAKRPVVLILDNCEHVADAVADCASTLLMRCPGLRIVATSREPIGLDAERQVSIGPMPDHDAATLFLQRAEAVQPLLHLDDETRSDVTELCRHLDGLPLAIELAAARTKTLPLPEITARLADRFDLLRRTGRGGAGRHDGLRAAIDWSYESLFEEEQRAFRRLAVFAGGATTVAVRASCGADALDLISRLVDKSLLVADTSGTSARFRMLESLRAYGIDRLTNAGQLDDALAAHRQWCTHLAEQAEIGIRGVDQLAWLDRLDADHDNLRAAVSHAVAAAPEEGLRLIGALIVPWWFRGRRQEARHWVESCLAAARDAPPIVRAKALAWCGLLTDSGQWTEQAGGLEHDLDLADRRQREATVLALQAGDHSMLAYCRLQHALTLARRALAGVAVDGTALQQLIELSVGGFAELGDDFGGGLIQITEAVAALAARDLPRVSVAVEVARAHSARSGDRFVRGRAAWIEGLLAQAAGDTVAAYRHIERGLRLLDELGMGREVTAQAEVLVTLAEQAGEHDLAAQWRVFVGDSGGGLARHDLLVLASARNARGLRARADGDFEAARAAHLEALARYTEAGVAGGVAYTESCLGFLADAMGQREVSAAHHATALGEAVRADDSGSLALAIEGVAAGFTDDGAQWAATMLGAATALWDGSAAHEPATHRDDVAEIAERARRLLGPEAFDEAFTRGAALDRAETLVVARSGRLA